MNSILELLIGGIQHSVGQCNEHGAFADAYGQSMVPSLFTTTDSHKIARDPRYLTLAYSFTSIFE